MPTGTAWALRIVMGWRTIPVPPPPPPELVAGRAPVSIREDGPAMERAGPGVTGPDVAPPAVLPPPPVTMSL
jgi:hypothetical protein